MYFISSGCSFTQDPHTWPYHFAEKLGFHHYPMGIGSNGNDLIARRAIWKVNQLLKNNVDPRNIVVGVMWSAPNRAQFYVDNNIVLHRLSIPKISASTHFSWPENDRHGKWVLINAGFENQFANNYYRFYTNNTMDAIKSYENILRLQNYLKLNNIKYFFSSMNEHVFSDIDVQTIHTDYLKEMIDWSRVLPVKGCYEWCRDNMPDDFPVPGDDHPSGEQYCAFVESVVIPFYYTLP